MRVRPWAAALLLVTASCADTAASLNKGLVSISSELEELLSGERKPNEHLDRIRSVHLPNSLTFDPAVEHPVEDVREAIRGLAAADYGTWRDAAFALQVLSSLAIEHPVALIRTEALDAVASMAYWTFEAEVENGNWATEAQLLSALRELSDVARSGVVDDDTSRRLADAVRTASAFDFETSNPLPDSVSGRVLGRDFARRLRHVRAVLLPVTGRVIEPYLSDPEVLSAADRCCASLSASIVRLTLSAAVLTDESVTTRTAAARLLGNVQFAGARVALRRVLREDPDAAVRREALQSLARHGIDRVGDALIGALDDDTASVRGAAARQLQSLSGQDFGDDRRAWRNWWDQRSGAPEDAAPVETGH